MRTVALMLTASILVVPLAAASSATIHNNETSIQVLRIVENGQEQRYELQPSSAATDLCKTVCELYIGNDPDPYEVSATDELIIEGGNLYEARQTNEEPNPQQQQ